MTRIILDRCQGSMAHNGRLDLMLASWKSNDFHSNGQRKESKVPSEKEENRKGTLGRPQNRIP
jgi:hypothetical protein